MVKRTSGETPAESNEEPELGEWTRSERERKDEALKVYQFKISLLGINPVIWRRLRVPAYYTFWDLHVAIQDAMGWLDCHLHLFRISDPGSGVVVDIGIPVEEGVDDEREVIPGWEAAIEDYFSATNDLAEYAYDFGDGWEHALAFEGAFPRREDASYPVCVDGRRACPPEDCGGVWGYEEMLQALADPSDERHAELRETLGDDYNPETFDPAAVRFSDPRERLGLTLGPGN